ncbi:MAG TPA: hypothetical protein ENN43_01515, partial [bacterium]|nr:hypothetical protein [bacterium]
MNKNLRDLLVLFFVLFVGFNIVVNRYMKMFLDKYNPGIGYLFAVSFIPDRVSFVNVKYGAVTAQLLTMDVNLRNLIKKDYRRFLDGIAVTGLKAVFEKSPKKGEKSGGFFALPFCRYIIIRNASIEYEDWDAGAVTGLVNINGRSVYNKGAESEQYMLLNCEGSLLRAPTQKVYLKFFLYPYYTNRFFVNVYGTGIEARNFENFFRKNNLEISSGKINFVTQIKGEKRKVYLNNIMEFNGLKIREKTGIDLKALFGVSYEQMTRFLSGAGGNFTVNFDFTISDSELRLLPSYYGSHFMESVGGRVKLGVITAPVRGVTDLI